MKKKQSSTLLRHLKFKYKEVWKYYKSWQDKQEELKRRNKNIQYFFKFSNC